MPKNAVAAEEYAPMPDILTPETPQQRQMRIAQAVDHARSIQSDIKQGLNLERDNQVMRKAHRFAVESDMSLADLAMGIDDNLARRARQTIFEDMPVQRPNPDQQILTEAFPTNHDDLVMEEIYGQYGTRREQPRQYAPQPQQRPQQRQFLTERQPAPQQRPQRQSLSEEVGASTGGNWKVRRYLGETKSGQEVHVWKVENTRSGSSLRNMFRIEEVAQRIALILNESGDSNDPRAVSLVNAYEKRDKLLKEARALQREAEGKPMKSQRLQAIRAEINQLDYKLGV